MGEPLPCSFDVKMNGTLLGTITRAYSATGTGTFVTASYSFTVPHA